MQCSSRRSLAALGGMWLLTALVLTWSPAQGQAPSPETPAAGQGQEPAQADATEAEAPAADPPRLNLWHLLVQGGIFMIPLALISVLAVMFTIERGIALRRRRVIPDRLVRELGQMSATQEQFDPREAYRICQKYPSAAANVIRAMLFKVGRPHSEVEHTVAEASQREADRLYSNVRWLNLAVAVAPLMGLLGTVWGMIQAFHSTTQLLPGQSKAEHLARGIYEALVTTLVGLLIAIPAAIFAHYFEGRVRALFHEVDELMFNLMPHIERFEGRVRFTKTGSSAGTKPAVGAEKPAAGAEKPAAETKSVAT